jgi:hypothetical protein
MKMSALVAENSITCHSASVACVWSSAEYGCEGYAFLS